MNGDEYEQYLKRREIEGDLGRGLSGRALADAIADALSMSYDELMEHAEGYFSGEIENTRWNDYNHNIGSNMSYQDFTMAEWQRFWDYYEEVSGNKVMDKSGHPFSCSC